MVLNTDPFGTSTVNITAGGYLEFSGQALIPSRIP